MSTSANESDVNNEVLCRPECLNTTTSSSVQYPVAKSWHNDSVDGPHRKIITDLVFELLKNKFAARSRAIPDQKIHLLANRLERILYFDAECLLNYMDTKTLKQRLHVFALSQKSEQESEMLCYSCNQPSQPLESNVSTALADCPHDVDQSNRERSDSEAEEERKLHVLKQQQQRLLLLRHSSQCTHQGACPVTRHCATMKQLWTHILVCRSQNCSTEFCISSRFVLAHYTRCRDSTCDICDPVRTIIRVEAVRRRCQQETAVLNSAAAACPDVGPVCSRVTSVYAHRKICPTMSRRGSHLPPRSRLSTGGLKFQDSIGFKRSRVDTDDDSEVGTFVYEMRQYIRKPNKILRVEVVDLDNPYLDDDSVRQLQYLIRGASNKGYIFGNAVFDYQNYLQTAEASSDEDDDEEY